MRTTFSFGAACVLFAAASACRAQTSMPLSPEQILLGGSMASAVTELQKPATGSADNHVGLAAETADRRRFALGIAQSLRAIEKLQTGFHTLGPRRDGIGRYLPMVRLMGNDEAEAPPAATDGVGGAVDAAAEKLKTLVAVPVTADLIDFGLRQFRDDLAEAIRTLDGIKDPDVNLTLPLLKLKLDVNGLAPGGVKSIGDMLKRLNVIDARSAVLGDDLTVRLDAGDVAWLRGYLHLLSAVTELTLAYDKTELIDTCGDLIFRKVAHSPTYPKDMTPLFPVVDKLDIVDIVAFVHQLRLPLKDAKAVAAARTHLLATINDSRTSWAAILKETDDDHEWIPNPNQKCVLPRMAVTKETVDGWLAFLDDGQAVLDGTKLIPFWRASDGRGLNVKKLTDAPPSFDLVMWVQGAAIGPYLEKGPLATAATYRRLDRLLGGDFFTFAVWVN